MRLAGKKRSLSQETLRSSELLSRPRGGEREETLKDEERSRAAAARRVSKKSGDEEEEFVVCPPSPLPGSSAAAAAAADQQELEKAKMTKTMKASREAGWPRGGGILSPFVFTFGKV